IITGTGENGGPHLRVFEKDGTQRGIQFFPFSESFRGGMDVASGDFDGDGKEDIAVSQFSNGQAWVKIYKYNADRTILFERNVFGVAEIGATVAMGNLDSDSADELIVGAGTDGDPIVKIFDYNPSCDCGTLKPISFNAFTGGIDYPVRSGIDVSAGDVDGDGKDEIAVSRLKEEYSWVKIFRYNSDQTVLGEFRAYGDYLVGANVEMFDIDSDGLAEIITGPGSGGGPQVKAFEYDGIAIDTLSFFAYDEGFRGGVDVGVYGEAIEEENGDDSSSDNSDSNDSDDSDDSSDDSDNSEDVEIVNFITENPVDLSQIKEISKFRSCVGHDYSGYNTDNELETGRSMKHYLAPIDSLVNSDYSVKAYAPFSGEIIRNELESNPRGRKVTIEGFDWQFTFFHTDLVSGLVVGSEVSAGDLIGHADLVGAHDFDIAVSQISGGREILDSAFSHMSSSVLQEYTNRGVTLNNAIISKAVRDASNCDFSNSPASDWITLN
ncbi:MAG: VCBS repeat-containing protein, partial [Parcubacteria group bacterium]|nr:VCBS repeat-containing protein [Parcubacteria group bacterium]